MASAQEKQAILDVCKIVLLTVKAAGNDGAPAGPMYAACMHTMSLESFNKLTSALVQSGYMKKQGHLFFHLRDL